RRPGDRDTAMTLLKTYNICGMGVEASEEAAKLRPALPAVTVADLPVLHEEALGYLTAKDYDRLDSVLDRIAAIAPTDLQGHVCRMGGFRARTQRDKARAYADALLAQHPDDPGVLIVAAISRQIEPGPQDADQAVQL